MSRTACTEPQCLYKGAIYLTLPIYETKTGFVLYLPYFSFYLGCY